MLKCVYVTFFLLLSFEFFFPSCFLCSYPRGQGDPRVFFVPLFCYIVIDSVLSFFEFIIYFFNFYQFLCYYCLFVLVPHLCLVRFPLPPTHHPSALLCYVFAFRPGLASSSDRFLSAVTNNSIKKIEALILILI